MKLPSVGGQTKMKDSRCAYVTGCQEVRARFGSEARGRRGSPAWDLLPNTPVPLR